MATNIAELVNKMPELDQAGVGGRADSAGKLTGFAWAKAGPIIEGVLAAGREGLVELIKLIREVDDGADYKARYTLHGIVIYVCRDGKEKERALVIQTLASQIGGAVPKSVQGFLIRELLACGDASVIPVLGKLLADDEIGDDACAALLAIGGAVEQFRAALPVAKGRRRLNVVQALGVLKDAQSIPALRLAATDADREIRLAAIWGLANIGDDGSADLALKAADAEGWERIKATSACILLAERLTAAGKKDGAKRIYAHLQKTRTDAKERHIQEAAARGLAGLG